MDIDDSDAPPPGTIFDEAWYLSEYPAVAEIVRAGGFRSGWQHYHIHGRHEGRHPAPVTRMTQSIADGTMRRPERAATPPFWNHNGAGFLTPDELSVSGTRPERVAVVAPRSLEVRWLHECTIQGCHVDVVTVDSISGLPVRTPDELASYDFVVIQISLREVIDDNLLRHVPYSDTATHARAFHRACQILEAHLTSRMRWNRDHGTLTFVANFFVPQQNPMGRLFPRHDIRNPEYFISELNRHLDAFVLRRENAFVLDLDRLATSIGRRFVQDDMLFPFEYGAVLPFDSREPGWVGPLASISDHYDIRTRSLFPDMAWAELLAMHRSARKVDPVNLIVVELVDTLWKARGGPGTGSSEPVTAGWPAGVADALVRVRKRGIQLAIVSKNDERLVREIWPKVFGDGLRINDFSAIRINWRKKSENMSEVLHELNLPSNSVVFIDADPAEREAMRVAFPDIRTLGNFPYYLRRILLWSPETQGAAVHDDWARRPDVIQAPSGPNPTDAGITLRSTYSQGAMDPAGSAFDTPRQRLDALWSQALNNDITPEEAEEIRRLSLGIAVADRGLRRVRPFSDRPGR